MRLKLSGKFLPIVIAVVLLMVMVPAVSAYEAHVVDIKARVVAPATRTVGFWKTHVAFTEHVFNDYLGSNIDICWREIYTMSELMGVFWANTAQNSDNTTRSELCKARVKTSRQALAAILNSALPNGAHLPVTIDDIQDILCDTDVDAINDLGTILDIHNNTYDDVPIQDNTGIGGADPAWAQSIANLPFADCP